MNTHPTILRKPKVYWLTGLVILTALVITACQTGAIPITGSTPAPEQAETAPVDTPRPAPEASPTPEMSETEEAEISVVNHPDYGNILIGNDNMTLYIFTVDGPNQSNCDDACLAIWPPLITRGSPILGAGVDPDKIGSAELADGSMIVTYNEMPLYYWIQDQQPGDVLGQGVGGVWFVISPEGEPIGMDDEAGSAADEETEEPMASDMDMEVDIDTAIHPELGTILVGKDGMTLYMFAMDEPNISNCATDCLANWPPLLVTGEPTFGRDVKPDLVGTAELEDGSMIATYNERPLYYWVNDRQPGDSTGHGIGDVWFAINTRGEPAVPGEDSEDYLDPDY
jgi:predicted lipoprotein with Yx(FWY)xxD motif